jgi:hypothetical protein
MNEYNSPRAQMQRFKEAGLNPNLIYGQSNEGATVRSTDQAKWNPEAPQYDLGSAAQNSIATYQNVQMQNAQLDLIAKQSAVQEQEAILKMATTAQTVANTEKTTIESATLAKYSLEAAAASLKKMQVDTAAATQQIDLNLQKNEREALSNAQSLREGVLRVAQLKVQNAKTEQETKNAKALLNNLETDNELKQADLRMKEKGVQPSDNLFFRAAAQLLTPERIKSIKDFGNTPEKKEKVTKQEAEQYLKDRKKRKGY